MQTFTTTMAGLVALIASASAQTAHYAVMTSPSKDQMVTAGDTLTVKWEPGNAKGMVTINLLGGESPTTLVPLKDITTSQDVTTGSFSWPVDCSLGDDKTYGLKIISNDDENLSQYGFPFHISSSDSCSIGDGSSDGGDGSDSTATPGPGPSTMSPPPAPTITDTFSTTPTSSYPSAPTITDTFTNTSPLPTTGDGSSSTTMSVPSAPTVTDPAPTATLTTTTTGGNSTPTGTTGGNGGETSSTPSPSADPDSAAAGLKVSFGAAIVAGLVAVGL